MEWYDTSRVCKIPGLRWDRDRARICPMFTSTKVTCSIRSGLLKSIEPSSGIGMGNTRGQSCFWAAEPTFNHPSTLESLLITPRPACTFDMYRSVLHELSWLLEVREVSWGCCPCCVRCRFTTGCDGIWLRAAFLRRSAKDQWAKYKASILCGQHPWQGK